MFRIKNVSCQKCRLDSCHIKRGFMMCRFVFNCVSYFGCFVINYASYIKYFVFNCDSYLSVVLLIKNYLMSYIRLNIVRLIICVS